MACVERVLEVLGGRLGARAATDLLTTSPTAAAASAASSPSASELPTTATRRPRGSGWWASSWATSNISSRVSTWITPGLPEHRVDRLLRRGDLAHGVAHRHALRRAARPHRDDRLAQRHPARDPGELARVADRLEVEQHDLGGVVLLPVLQQVVAGHVGPVAGADERREAQAAVVDLLQDRGAERPGLAEEPGPAAGRHQRRQRGVERRRRVGVDDAEAVRPDQAQPVGAGEARPAVAAAAGPPRRSRRSRTRSRPGRGRPCAAQSSTTSCTASAGTATIATSTSPGMSLTEAYAGRPRHRLGRRVHGVDPAGEVAGDEVAHQRLADGVLAAAGADHGDRARVEEPLDRGRLGPVLARDHHADRGVGRVDAGTPGPSRRRRSRCATR